MLIGLCKKKFNKHSESFLFLFVCNLYSIECNKQLINTRKCMQEISLCKVALSGMLLTHFHASINKFMCNVCVILMLYTQVMMILSFFLIFKKSSFRTFLHSNIERFDVVKKDYFLNRFVTSA